MWKLLLQLLHLYFDLHTATLCEERQLKNKLFLLNTFTFSVTNNYYYNEGSFIITCDFLYVTCTYKLAHKKKKHF